MSCVLYRGQDFEKAGSLRDKEMELKAQISKITNQAKESEQAEVESGDNTGPMVTEADIANIVAQWTGTRSNTSLGSFCVCQLCCSVCSASLLQNHLLLSSVMLQLLSCKNTRKILSKGPAVLCIMLRCNMQRVLLASHMRSATL